MARGIASTRVICCLALASCTALCQQREVASMALPEAPRVQTGIGFDGGRLSQAVQAEAGQAGAAQSEEFYFDSDEPAPGGSRDFFSRHLSPTLPKMTVYRPATKESLVGRATYAASHTFVTHDISGKGRLNTSYFLRVLSATALHTASVPY